MNSLGETLKDPRKWAIVEALEHPKRYWDNQAWGLKHASGSIAYALGKGIQTTGTVIQVPQKFLHNTAKKGIKDMVGNLFGSKAGKKAAKKFSDFDDSIGQYIPTGLEKDLNIAGKLLEPVGELIADLGAQDQEKLTRYMIKQRKKN